MISKEDKRGDEFNKQNYFNKRFFKLFIDYSNKKLTF